MELRDYIRPVITGLVAIGVVILVIILLVKLFTHHSVTPLRRVDVGAYQDSAATATLLVDTPTNIDQDHRQMKITVSQTSNEIDIYQGYQNSVLATRTYPNNSSGYGFFLQALKLMNYSSGNSIPKDYRGYCPQGDRYVYSFNDGQTDLFSYWSASCGPGTFRGQAANVRDLFYKQIPQKDFATLVSQYNIAL